jgi:hypothetical protein
MAIKWAFIGAYCSILHLNHQHMSNIYGFSSNDDWSAQDHKITKAKHRDVILNRLFDAVKKNMNKANKAFIKTYRYLLPVAPVCACSACLCLRRLSGLSGIPVLFNSTLLTKGPNHLIHSTIIPPDQLPQSLIFYCSRESAIDSFKED